MDVDPPFGLYTSYPRREIPLKVGTLQDLSIQTGTLLSIEKDAIEFDPLMTFKELVPVQVNINIIASNLP